MNGQDFQNYLDEQAQDFHNEVESEHSESELSKWSKEKILSEFIDYLKYEAFTLKKQADKNKAIQELHDS